MQSICWTTRLVSRALRNGFSTLVEPNSKVKPHFVSVACGFPKDFLRSKYKLGRFGEDAWFVASTQNADVIGKWFDKKKKFNKIVLMNRKNERMNIKKILFQLRQYTVVVSMFHSVFLSFSLLCLCVGCREREVSA